MVLNDWVVNMNNEEQDKINAEHIRKAETNRNAEYVDLWKKTKFTRAKQNKCSKGVVNGSRLISRKNNKE